MRTNQDGVDLLKKWEGFSPTPYLCPAGKPTIGYGHRVQNWETWPDPITETQAEQLLKTDLISREKFLTEILRTGRVLINLNQFAAMTCLMYNIGEHSFQHSTLLRYVLAGKFEDAAEQFLVWDKHKVNGTLKLSDGLRHRREDERALFLRGIGDVGV